MLMCPRCGDEFEAGITRCPDHDVPLVAPGTPLSSPPPSDPDATLGRFHPALVDVIVAVLEREDVPYERQEDGAVTVPREDRDDIRSELVTNWDALVAQVPEEERRDVRREGGMLPGWRDAPQEVWVDREGRLQVGSPDDVGDEQEGNALGPGLLAGGIAALLVAWTIGGEIAPVLWVGGGLAVLLGAFLPR